MNQACHDLRRVGVENRPQRNIGIFLDLDDLREHRNGVQSVLVVRRAQQVCSLIEREVLLVQSFEVVSLRGNVAQIAVLLLFKLIRDFSSFK